MRARYWMLGLVFLTQWAVAEGTQRYYYGQALDIARVISIEMPQGCEVGEAILVYEDSNGDVHTLFYLRHGENCSY